MAPISYPERRDLDYRGVRSTWDDGCSDGLLLRIHRQPKPAPSPRGSEIVSFDQSRVAASLRRSSAGNGWRRCWRNQATQGSQILPSLDLFRPPPRPYADTPKRRYGPLSPDSCILAITSRIESSAIGSSRVVKSPVSRPSVAARIARRRTLPDLVLGSARIT
jgi:hypothetical protein